MDNLETECLLLSEIAYDQQVSGEDCENLEGINDMLAENLDEGCFYLSANDEFERSRDGAHPTRESAHKWMDRVVKWIGESGAHPILLNDPGEGISRASRIVIYQPPK